MKPSAASGQFGRTLSGRSLNLLYRSGVLESMLKAGRTWLTALSYHRVEDPFRAGFYTYKPNISATPSQFRQQVEYLRAHYNLITCERLACWLRGEQELPPRPAIITFDDGYADNMALALPILQQLAVPATIFLCSGSIGSAVPFVWDYAAYCFSCTRKSRSELPLTGPAEWSDEVTRELVMRQWFQHAKSAQDAEKRKLVEALAKALDVDVPADAFTGLYLNWDQVRELDRSGIEMGAHTVTHPILTSIPLERARQEIMESKSRIEAELGKPVIGFAYPNGGRGDFSPEIMSLLREAGIEVAFTLLSGPTRLRTVASNPLAIRRIFVGYNDTFPRFLAKLAGFARYTWL